MTSRPLIVALFGLAMMALLGLSAASQTRFLSGAEDLPLMVGLEETADDALVFDTPGGRLIEASATGTLNAAQVTAFYAETLPQLGWHALEENGFAREGELLRIELTERDGALKVRFTITPEPF